MAGAATVGIVGVGIVTGWADASLSLTDLIFKATSAAVDDSGIDMTRIDSVVLSAHDLVDGRSLSSMVTAPAAGAYLRDEIRLASDGLAALSLAAARIESGESEYSIVAAWGRASEGNYVRTSQAAFDPAFEQAFRPDEFTLSAMRLSAWCTQHGVPGQDRLDAAAARRARARANPHSISGGVRFPVGVPLIAEDAPLMADIAVAMIIGRGQGAVRLAGFGHSAGSAMIGARDLVAAQPLRDAVGRASTAAGLRLDQADIYCLAGPTLSDEALTLEVLGLAAEGGGFAAYADMAQVNPAGGSESGWCYPTCGLVNALEAYLQLTGRAGPVQVGGNPRRALVTGVSAMGGQVAHAVFMETMS